MNYNRDSIPVFNGQAYNDVIPFNTRDILQIVPMPTHGPLQNMLQATGFLVGSRNFMQPLQGPVIDKHVDNGYTGAGLPYDMRQFPMMLK